MPNIVLDSRAGLIYIMCMEDMEMKDMVTKINRALKAGGYKPEEATARYWGKANEEGQITIERIYLSGKKANGYISIDDGKPVLHDSKFLNITRIVEAAL